MAEVHEVRDGRPLRGYGLLLGTFVGSSAAFAGWLSRCGTQVPDRVDLVDRILVAVANKASRLVTKDRVTRGSGLPLAVGEMLVYPYCVGVWIAAAAIGGLIARPRFRWSASALVALSLSDFLQIAYKKAEQAL